MGLLVLGWGSHAEAGVEPTVVPPVDPAGGRVFDVGDGFEGPLWKTVVRIASVLNRPISDSMSALS